MPRPEDAGRSSGTVRGPGFKMRVLSESFPDKAELEALPRRSVPAWPQTKDAARYGFEKIAREWP